MDKLELQEVIHEKETRLKNLERMADKYEAAGKPLAAQRTNHRATEVVEDLIDLRNALAEFEERDGQIRTGADEVDSFRRAVEKGLQEDDGKGPRREGYADGHE